MAKKSPPKTQQKELIDQLQRLQAEFDNYRKRTEAEREKAKARATEHLIRELLPVLDNFSLAVGHAKESMKPEDLLQGITMIQEQLTTTLESHGLERIPTETFNPSLHEALTTVESDKPKGAIVQVYQDGYTIQGTIMRPAKVSVAKGGTENGK